MKHKLRIFSVFTDRKMLYNCRDRTVCEARLLSIVNDGMETDDGYPSVHQFLWYMLQARWDVLCGPCGRAVRDGIARRREMAWIDLGRIFKVTSWPSNRSSKLLEDSE